jgi:hypothetical protein
MDTPQHTFLPLRDNVVQADSKATIMLCQFKLKANPFQLYIILYTNILIFMSYGIRHTSAHF